MRFVHFPIVKFSGFLGAGIVFAKVYPVSRNIFPILLLSLLLAFLLWLWTRRQLIQTIYFGLSVYISFFLLGYWNYQLCLPLFQDQHYSHYTDFQKESLLQLKISESLKEDSYYRKYFAKVLATDGEAVNGKILLNIQKDSLTSPLKPDQILVVKTKIHQIPRSLNPHQFEYSSYLEIENVYHQIITSQQDFLSVTQGKPTIFGIAQNFRSSILEKLRNSPLKKDERSIIQALVLGEKKDISKELYQQYAAAGAVHILAVSGLHVGILFAILSFIFKPIVYMRHGYLLRSVLILLFLWAFAFLAGLSPSVLRAVIMFSFFTSAPLFSRRSSGINNLFLSFMVLVLINPMNLFKVGFQLSYCAVFFILWLHPLLRKFTYSNNRFWCSFKELVSVTMSAQIGVLPLSLFYFHQFPGLFLITNIVILPVLGIYMSLGIIIVILSSVNFLPFWLANGYNMLVSGLNGFVGWIAQQDQFILKDVHFPLHRAILAFVFIFLLGMFFMNPTRKRNIATSTAFLLLIGVFLWDEKQQSTNEVIVFHKTRESVIGIKQNRELKILVNDSTKNPRNYPFVTSYIAAKNINKISSGTPKTIFKISDNIVFIIDSIGQFPHEPVDFLIITGSPQLNLDRLEPGMVRKKIIADGSSYPSYVRLWEESAKRKKLPFHYTGKDGALKIE